MPTRPWLKNTLEILFRFAATDHDRHLMPCNGVPETQGYHRFYDDRRAQLRDAPLRLRSAIPATQAR